MDNKKMYIYIGIAVFVVLGIIKISGNLSASNNSAPAPSVNPSAISIPTSTPFNTPTPANAISSISQIEVNIEVQDVVDKKQKVVVWVKNTSTQTFNGHLYVYGNNAQGKSTGNDTAIIENLEAGKATYYIMWFKPSDSPDIKHSWNEDYSFK